MSERKFTIKIALLKKDKNINEALNEEYSKKIEQKDDYQYVLQTKIAHKENPLIKKLVIETEPSKEMGRLEETFYKGLALICWKQIILKKEKRILLIAIGDIRSLIKSDYLENNFGLKLGINKALENDEEIIVKEITTKNNTNGDNFKQGKNVGSSIDGFDFRNASQILRTIKIKTVNREGQLQTLTLNKWYQFAISENIATNLLWKDILNLVQKYFMSTKYLENYKFIDNFASVEKEVEEELWSEIYDDINSKHFEGFFAWPDFEYEAHTYYTIRGIEKQLFSLENDKIIDIIKSKKVKSLKNIFFESHSDESMIEEKNIKNMIFAEKTRGSKKYILIDGHWLMVDDNFYQEVENDYHQLESKLWDTEMPNWNKSKNEATYNKEVSEQRKWILLDRKLIQIHSRSRLEVADLYTDKESDTLIAVKRGNESSSISHLIQQVANSLRLIRKNPNLIKVQSEIDFSQTKTFVLAIGTEKNEYETLPKIPFFGKISLVEFCHNSPYKFDIKLKWIRLV